MVTAGGPTPTRRPLPPTHRHHNRTDLIMDRPKLRARVTYAFGAWWYDLRTGPEFAEYTHPNKFATPALAANAARRELAIRTEQDPVRRILMRLGALPIPTAASFALAR